MTARQSIPSLAQASSQPRISVVIPAYNEAENLPVLIDRIRLALVSYSWVEILIVDDGSTDQTRAVIERMRSADKTIHYLSFSRNFGHQAALRAGYEHARGECVVSLDADGQHPPELIPALIQQWQRGYAIVATQRKEDQRLPFFKRFTSRLFYRLIRSVSDLELNDGYSDFRLLDRQVVEALKKHPESDMFLRGLVAYMGFPHCCLPYQPASRLAGTSKYSLQKMLKLALGGITSFSTRPLYLSVLLGFGMFLFAMLFGMEVLYEKYFTHATVSGWTTIILLLVLIGGFQFIMIGIMGIYLGKAFIEVKKRPPYLIHQSSYIDELPYQAWPPVLTESYLQ